MFRYEFWWMLTNRLRIFFGRKPQVRRCCKNPENLLLEQLRPDLVANVCQVCGSRHFELAADAGKIGLQGRGI